MKSIKFALLLATLFYIPWIVNAQRSEIQYFRQPSQEGVNEFEAPKETDVEFDGVDVRVGGGLALQFQGIRHENEAGSLAPLTSNFNLPTANLDLDVQLYDGMRMHLRTYLSSRHHPEAYVKGGYLQVDNLNFIEEGLLSELMDKVRIKVGHMELNYGDAHFRRTDNGSAIYNPFVGNYLLDAFTTEVAGEVYYLNNGIIAMVGLSNGRLNQSVKNTTSKPALLAKLGFDRELSDDVRVRLTGSVYTTSSTSAIYLYSGDRAGARYYAVMDTVGGNDFRSGRINPGMSSDMTSIMINPFVKIGGLEFFGLIESISGRSTADVSFTGNRNWTHLGAELLYRFGANEDFYLGGRYNSASGQLPNEETDKVSISRINIGGGWFMTPNVLTKVEYVSQSYNDYPAGSVFDGGQFNGVAVEAAISF